MRSKNVFFSYIWSKNALFVTIGHDNAVQDDNSAKTVPIKLRHTAQRNAHYVGVWNIQTIKYSLLCNDGTFDYVV